MAQAVRPRTGAFQSVCSRERVSNPPAFYFFLQWTRHDLTPLLCFWSPEGACHLESFDKLRTGPSKGEEKIHSLTILFQKFPRVLF